MNMDVFDQKEKMMSGYKKKADELFTQFQEDDKHFKSVEGKAHIEWLRNLSPAERTLKDRIYDLNENLFGDLSFEEQLEEEGDVDKGIDDRIMQPLDTDPLEKTRYIIDPDIDVMGQYNPMNNTITFHPDHLLDEHITHEMLHVYEHFYGERPLMKDFWITRLYFRLHSKVEGLNGYCCQLGLMRGEVLDQIGGEHGVFFLLKSLDLDIRLNRPFGTVFGYSKVFVFEE